jgi:hypothetical protein
MNALQQDIINTIRKHGASRTVEICEDLIPLGYGGAMSFDDFKTWIGKTISKMKAEGHVIGEDRPNPGTKPVRYWSLPEPVTEESLATEMDSDIAEIEQGEWSDAKTFEHKPDQHQEIPAPNYDPRTVAFVKRPMSAAKILREFANLGMEDDRAMGVFMDGIAAAERHHGIAE